MEDLPCPYHAVCQCPGGEDYRQKGGFKLMEDEEKGSGILCVDFGVFLPFSMAAKARRREGWHVADAFEAAEKIDVANKKYSRSKKRREAQKRYEKSVKGKETKRRYYQSEGFKLAYKRWLESDKGKECRENRKERKLEFKKIELWLKENPGKTAEDYFNASREEG